MLKQALLIVACACLIECVLAVMKADVSEVSLFAVEVATAFLNGLHAYQIGHLEPELPGHILAVIPPLCPHIRQVQLGTVVQEIIDVGANVGDFTSQIVNLCTDVVQRRFLLQLSEKGQKDHLRMSAILVEPTLDTFDVLRTRMETERWDLVANITLLNIGLAPDCAHAKQWLLHRSSAISHGKMNSMKPTNTTVGIDAGALDEVRCSPVRPFIAERVSLAKHEVFFLKVDIEGGDIALLLAIGKALRRVRFLGFEHIGPQLHQRLFQHLRQLGFACFLLHQVGLLPLFGGVFEKVNFLMEMLPGSAKWQWNQKGRMNGTARVMGDIFCGHGCDKALLDVLWLTTRKNPPLPTMQVLSEKLLMQEFACSSSDVERRVADMAFGISDRNADSNLEFGESFLNDYMYLEAKAVSQRMHTAAFFIGRELLFGRSSFTQWKARSHEIGHLLLCFAVRHKNPFAALFGYSPSQCKW